MTQFAVLLGTLAIASALGLLWRRGDGRPHQVVASDANRMTPDVLATLGIQPGERATLVQFSSAFCQPCRATRRILRDVSRMVEGVAYAEVDAERHLDLVRRFHVLRTPTTFVLDRTGRVVVRASGQPRKPDVIAAVGRAIDSGATSP